MKRIKLTIYILALVYSTSVLSKEGLWLPYIADQLNYENLKANGFKLTAEDIYSINQACLTDAILIFGDGCTGEVVSENGLIFTNHHCGISQIQAHTTIENNYLRDGFWAKNNQEELPNPGLTVKFLSGVEEFSRQVLFGVDKSLPYDQQKIQIDSIIEEIQKSIEDTSMYSASIEEFYSGNTYYLFLYKEFADVRLVGTPPESIANFGGDTDNWVWPRHSCDFSAFRIYTSPDGNPAGYSEQNIPLKPEKYLKIFTGGVAPGDFTMILGYPGRTTEYLYSRYLGYFSNKVYPIRIKIREGTLNIIDRARREDEKIYLDYASKQREISNSYKKWKGVVYGVNRFSVIEKRKAYEQWLIKNAGNQKSEINDIFQAYEDVFLGFEPNRTALVYFEECVWSVEPFRLFAEIFPDLDNLIRNPSPQAETLNNLREKSETFFRYYNPEIDKEITLCQLGFFLRDLGPDYMPSGKIKIQDEKSLKKYVGQAYSKSVLTDSMRFRDAIEKVAAGNSNVFMEDPMVNLLYAFNSVYYSELMQNADYYQQQVDELNMEYILLVKSIDTTRKIYPDANFTMRMTYGKVEGYSPSDGVDYLFQTHLDGLIEKSKTGIKDYQVTDKLFKMYETKDYGRYADENGKLPVCFTASNHTSGGNSGSPVLDSEGRLIGINFDRTWEGTMSDFNYDESICRNIAIDIRYVLFIIDKYSGAGYLLNEMDIEK